MLQVLRESPAIVTSTYRRVFAQSASQPSEIQDLAAGAVRPHAVVAFQRPPPTQIIELKSRAWPLNVAGPTDDHQPTNLKHAAGKR